MTLTHTIEMIFQRRATPLHMDTSLSDVLDLVAALVAGGLMVFIDAGRSGLPRILLALAFIGYVPGRAIIANWPQLSRWSGAAMPMVFSLALVALLATTTLWAHYWHPLGLFQVEAGLSLAGLAIAGARRHWRELDVILRWLNPRSRTGA